MSAILSGSLLADDDEDPPPPPVLPLSEPHAAMPPMRSSAPSAAKTLCLTLSPLEGILMDAVLVNCKECPDRRFAVRPPRERFLPPLGGTHPIVDPPLTLSTCPVTKLASPDARYA